MSRHASWKLDGSLASLQVGALSARLELRRPETGLMQLAVAGSPAADNLSAGVALADNTRILAVTAPAHSTVAGSLVEAYQRGPDLIATYGPSDDHPFRYQAYWRAQPTRYPGALAAVELVVSIQTHLLDSRPRLTASSLLGATAGWHWSSAEHAAAVVEDLVCPPSERRLFDAAGGIGCYRFRLAGSNLDYVEMVHPVDFQSSSLDSLSLSAANHATLLSHPLFAGQLEKGVILRSRVLGLLLDASVPNAMISDYYRSFVDEELPLTT
jgi:hypothetical protein